MAYLTFKQANTCESSANPVCKCRCKGALHGRSIASVAVIVGGCLPESYFNQLPENDPHFIPSSARLAEIKTATRLEQTIEKRLGRVRRYHAMNMDCRGHFRPATTDEIKTFAAQWESGAKGTDDLSQTKRIFICEGCGKDIWISIE